MGRNFLGPVRGIAILITGDTGLYTKDEVVLTTKTLWVLHEIQSFIIEDLTKEKKLHLQEQSVNLRKQFGLIPYSRL